MKTICCALITLGMFARLSIAVADEQSHRKAAENFLDAMDAQKGLDGALDKIVDAQIKANPQLSPMRNVLKQWVVKNFSYASLKDDLVAIYCAELTEDEMNQLAAFYVTPAGKQWNVAMPKINAKQIQLGASRAQAHQAELQKMLQDEQSKQTAPKQ